MTRGPAGRLLRPAASPVHPPHAPGRRASGRRSSGPGAPARRTRFRSGGARGGPGRAPPGRRRGVGVGARRGAGGAAWRSATARRGPGPGLRVTRIASGLARSSIWFLPAACSAGGPGSGSREESSRATQRLPGSWDSVSRWSGVPPRGPTTRAPRVPRPCRGSPFPPTLRQLSSLG